MGRGNHMATIRKVFAAAEPGPLLSVLSGKLPIWGGEFMMKPKTVLKTSTVVIGLQVAEAIEGRVENVHLPHEEHIVERAVGNAADSRVQTTSAVSVGYSWVKRL